MNPPPTLPQPQLVVWSHTLSSVQHPRPAASFSVQYPLAPPTTTSIRTVDCGFSLPPSFNTLAHSFKNNKLVREVLSYISVMLLMTKRAGVSFSGLRVCVLINIYQQVICFNFLSLTNVKIKTVVVLP